MFRADDSSILLPVFDPPQQVNIDRLDHVFVKNQPPGRAAVFVTFVNQSSPREMRCESGHCAHLSGDFKAIHAGQAYIEQYDVGQEVGGDGDCVGAGEGGLRRVAAQPLEHCHTTRRVGVIIDNENARGVCRAAPTSERVAERFAQDRQPHDELRAAPEALAARFDTPTVKLDQPPHQRESNAETAVRPIQRAAGLHKEIEDARQQIGSTPAPSSRTRMITSCDFPFFSLLVDF
jgi:hypothetical protein